MTKKNKLQSKLLTYEKRREAIRARYSNWVRNKEYLSKSRRLAKTIANIRRQINRIGKKEDALKLAHKQFCEFMHVQTIRGKGKTKDKTIYGGGFSGDKKKLIVARWVFCKYAIEKLGISGTLVSDFLGAKEIAYAGRARKMLTKKFAEKGIHYEQWKKTTAYLKSNQNEQEIKH